LDHQGSAQGNAQVEIGKAAADLSFFSSSGLVLAASSGILPPVELLDAKPPAAPSMSYRLFATVDQSYEAMLQAIEQAKKSVRLEMYIYTASPIGERFRDALVRACERGLWVKVLVDALGSMGLTDKFWEPLIKAGGQFRWFNPLTLKRFVFRNHRKSLVCDEQVAFSGGFNISTEYQGNGVTEGWHDLGIQVNGRLAAELATTFDWLFDRADTAHRLFTRLRKSTDKQLIAAPEGQLLLSGPGWGRNWLRKSVIEDIQRASEIQIISAYFLPSRKIRRALRQAARTGARVQLIMPGKSDVPIAQRAARRLYPSFMRAGIEIYEYQPQILHAKLFVFDDVVYAGSANLNLRSFQIDYELMFRVSNRQLASQAHAIIQQDIALCQRIDPVQWKKSRGFWTKLLESWSFFVVARVDPFIARRQLKTLR
jgi:cardiolipin synthase A/B